MRKHIGLIGALLIALAGVTVACSGNQQSTPEAKQAQEQHNIRAKQTIPENELKERPKATAARLEQLAKEIPEVKEAKCVIFGNMAIIGVDVDGNLERGRVGTIKYAVAEALRKDPVGIDAIVTADMDLYHRLQEIREDMAHGRLITGFADEMADIIGRIIPQLPRDTEVREEVPEAPGATTEKKGANKANSTNPSELDPGQNGNTTDNVNGEGNRQFVKPDAARRQ